MQLLSETKGTLTKSSISTGYKIIINNIYDVIAVLQFLYHTHAHQKHSSSDKVLFPSKQVKANIDEVVNLFPNFAERVNAIGIE